MKTLYFTKSTNLCGGKLTEGFDVVINKDGIDVENFFFNASFEELQKSYPTSDYDYIEVKDEN